MIRTVALATFIAGTLDITMAAVDASMKGGNATGMLRSVASGPFPGAGDWGAPGAAAGLGVHFAIMAAMATVFALASRHLSIVRARPLLAGAVYGFALWLLMYGVVLPIRFGAPFPSPDPVEIAKELFAHVVLVGMTISLVTDKLLGAPKASEAAA